jgi:hypothetical protein
MKKHPPSTSTLLRHTKLRIPKHERRPTAGMAVDYIKEFNQLNHLVPAPFVFRGVRYDTY